MERGPIPGGYFVCHHCDNPLCVRPSHLFLGTASDNMTDKTAKGRQTKGELVNTAKLSEAQVLEIRSKLSGGASRIELARVYGVGYSTISYIANGKSWKHLMEKQ